MMEDVGTGVTELLVAGAVQVCCQVHHRVLSRLVPLDKERDPRQVRLGPASRPGPQPPGVQLRQRMVHRGIIVEILAKGK